MNKKLYRAAFISSPIVALIGATPVYVVERVQFPATSLIWLILTSFIFIFWNINIFILSKVSDWDSPKRYILSYVTVLLMQIINVFILTQFRIKPPDSNYIFPFLGAIAINTLIIILTNSIIFQFQKERAELEVEQLKVMNLEAQKKMLMQQLQPHFLFNALSTLKSLISENPTSAEDYTVRLSDFLRYAIQAKDRDLVTVEEELTFAKDYIDLQKVRFGEALHGDIDVPEAALTQKIPVYAIQTLVENAIKHNAFTDKKPLFIHISMENNRLKIENNKGVKRQNTPSGTGLQNLKERYEIMEQTGLDIVETDTHFTVYLNLI
jgi:two-component system, LytTR family, sensor kinase